MNDKKMQEGGVDMSTMPLRWGHYRVLINSCMEQIIGAGLSTIAGVILPMMKLMEAGHTISSFMQGVIGASGLVGIALGSTVIGRLCDRYGYASFFRASAVLILIGGLLPWLFPHTSMLIVGLFIVGLGVGGGYVLDSNYVSEIMPDRWKSFMVGVVKGSCALGFLGVAGICWWYLSDNPDADLWPRLMLIMAAFGVVTLLMRIGWPDSPVWLMGMGRTQEAEKAAGRLLGPGVIVTAPPKPSAEDKATWGDMFRGENLKKVIFSGIPWACEGVGVYGVGVFLPILVMALGIDSGTGVGMEKVINSVKLTSFINFFILPGFVLGLLIVRRASHVRMLSQGFWISAIGMGVLLAAYLLHWPVWISIASFMLFEVALNAGPHLVTYIIPAQIYSVADRGAGSGIADMLGKVGAILGVFFMPMLLDAGGVTLVLIVCIAVMVVGALISDIFGPLVMKEGK